MTAPALPPAPAAGEASLSAAVTPRRARRPLWVFIAIWLAWGAVLISIRVQHPGMDTGEGWSDADIVNAGRFFDRFGYGLTHGLPRLDTAAPRPDEPIVAYNSYPPGPFWIHQGLKAVGLTSLVAQRIASQVWTHAGELLFFLIVWRLTRSGWLALLAAGLHMFSLPYAGYSSGFWINMGQPTLFGALYCWLRFEQSPAPGSWRWGKGGGRPWLAVACAITFVDFWIVLENGPAIAIFVGVRALMARRVGGWGRLFAAALVAAMPALVMLIRVVHAGWAAGDLGRGFRHFLSSGISRSIDGPAALTWFADGGVLSVWLSRLGWPLAADPALAHNRLFMYPVLGPMVLGAWLLLLGALVVRIDTPALAPARRGLWNGLLLLLAGLSWTILMRNHVWTHQFTVFTLMPGLAVILGALAYTGFSLAADGSWRRTPIRLLPAAAAVLVLGGMVAHLRTSDLLNHGWELDKARRARVRAAERDLNIMAAAGRRMEGWSDAEFERIVLHPKWPTVSHALGLPFVHAHRPPESQPAPGEVWALETWSQSARTIAARLSGTVGLPDVTSDPCHLIMFPSRGRTGGWTIPIRADIAGLGRITAVRIARTLDGAGVAVVWGLSGPGLEAALGRITLGVVLRDGGGREVGRANAWLRAAGHNRAVVWCTLPERAWKGPASVRLHAHDGIGRQPLEWAIAADLPEGASMAADRRGVDIDLAQWGPWARRSRLKPAAPPQVPARAGEGR